MTTRREKKMSTRRLRPRTVTETHTFVEKRKRLFELYESDPETFFSRFDKIQELVHKSYKIYLHTPLKKSDFRDHIRVFLKRRIRAYENYVYCGAFNPIPSEMKEFIKGLHMIISDDTNSIRLQRTITTTSPPS